MKKIALTSIAILTLILGFSITLTGQTIQITGKVTDAMSGKPISFVNVSEEGGSNTVFTDKEGNYTISAKKGAVLVFSSIGYETQKKPVGRSVMNVVLIPTIDEMDEVVTINTKERRQETENTRFTPPVVARDSKVSVSAEMCYEPHAKVPYLLQQGYMTTEEYNTISENRFKSVENDPLSTFSIDVDVASYSNMRRYINQGTLPPADAIRTEELVNYFTYNYSQPKGNDPVNISAEIAACPWNLQHRLAKIGIKAKELTNKNMPASNLVFLVDVSGSMYGPTRLDLVKSSLKLLINNLREEDRVAIVVYAGSAGLVLPSTSGSDKQKIREALDELTAGGSTAGGAGIKLAYKTAKENFIEGGNNRIILCTDGDFNVGVSSKEGLETMIEKERKSGVFLTVLGYGMGNYKDNRMQVLAEKGNGNHAYIDNLQEANKVLVNEFGGTMYTVAKDVKLQIEFNPEHVQAYRLIGYESRLLNNEDFNDDTKDAGEMGAGHTVTAFYEIVPTGVESNYGGKIDDLKYQKKVGTSKPAYTGSKEMLTVKLRYKQPNSDTSKKIELPVTDDKDSRPTSDFRFAAAVAMFGQLLRDSDFKGDASYDKVIALAKTALDNDEQGYRREFVRLAQAAKGLE